MRKVAIIGGGQSGLQLALGLLQNKYEVTLVSNRTPDQILGGRVTSSQFMFHDSLQNERDLVINFWEEKCPITEGIAFTIPGPDKTKALFWEAKLDHFGQSIDQRVKFTGWMKEFAKRGGNLVIQETGPREIDGYSKSHDLVLVAAGKGEINRMFERNAEKSPYDRPMRALALKVRIRRAGQRASTCNGFWSTATSHLMPNGCFRRLTSSGSTLNGW
jgi:flavin-dependent dehydrogenase